MRYKIVRAAHMAQYHEVNQNYKKFRFYIITSHKPVHRTD